MPRNKSSKDWPSSLQVTGFFLLLFLQVKYEFEIAYFKSSLLFQQIALHHKYCFPKYIVWCWPGTTISAWFLMKPFQVSSKISYFSNDLIKMPSRSTLSHTCTYHTQLRSLHLNSGFLRTGHERNNGGFVCLLHTRIPQFTTTFIKLPNGLLIFFSIF